jgi:predicted phage terminase large subunit-like protein
VTGVRLTDILPLYAFLDPAGPKKRNEGLKHVASRSAIVVGGQDDIGRVFVLHAWAARCGADALKRKIVEIHRRWNPKLFGCEENNLASLWSDALRTDPEWRTHGVKLIGITQPTNIEKDYRIRTTLQPIVGNGRMFLNENDPGILELRAEVKTFPMNARKDLIDALASLCRLMPIRAGRAGVDTEAAAYLRYLRETGADPATIEQEAHRLRSTALASGVVRA